jgi:hypothetical protein
MTEQRGLQAPGTSDTEIKAYLTIIGKGFNPEEVMRVVPIEPAGIWRMGQSPRPPLPPRQFDGVYWSTDSAVSLTTEAQLLSLLDRFQPYEHDLVAVCRRLNLEVEITCRAYVVDTTPDTHFSLSTLKRIVALGADLDVDIMLLRPEDEA